MEEIWKDIPGYEGLYQVSNLGRVRSLGNGNSLNPLTKQIRILSQYINFNYKCVTLNKNSFKKKHLIHRLVAITHIDNPNDYKIINHIDGIKTNNCISNLEWCTQSHNIIHSYKKGFQKPLTKKVMQFNLKGEFIREFNSMTEAAKINNIQISNLHKCCNGNRKKTGGFIWKYKS